MAFKITDSGVSRVTGRGANTVTLELSFAKIDAWAKSMGLQEAKLWAMSYGRACSGLKKKFFKVMQSAGGVEGVPKFKDFEDFTKQLRAARNRSSEPMGGILAEKSNIVAFKRNGYQVIGWPDRMESVATAFQEGRGGDHAEQMFTDPEYRRSWHRTGIKDVPTAYVHNPREVILPYFVDYVKKYLDEWARGNFYKELARQMEKRGAFA